MRIVGFDVETHATEQPLKKLVCLTWDDGTGAQIVLAKDAVSIMEEFLYDQDTLLVAHNAAFDLHNLRNAGVRADLIHLALGENRIVCTQTQAKLHAISLGELADEKRHKLPMSLAACLLRHCDIDISASKVGDDIWRLRYAELDGVPLAQWPEEALRYAKDDATLVRKLHSALPHFEDVFAQTRAAYALYGLSTEGIHVDQQMVSAFERYVEEKTQQGRELAQNLGFLQSKCVKGEWKISRNMKSLQALVVTAYAKSGREIPTTEKGRISTARQVLVESGNTELVEYARLGSYEKFRSTYIPILKNAPLYPSYDSLMATGRTSSYKPNIQNPPRAEGFRECLVPRPGYVFCSIDYDAAESRALAQILKWRYGSSKLGDLFDAGMDPHLWFAGQLWAAKHNAQTPEYGELKKALKDPAHPLYHEIGNKKNPENLRQFAKVANFGFPGGLGARGMVPYAKSSAGIILTEDEARLLRDRWLDALPETRWYFEDASRETAHGGVDVVQYISGRVRYVVSYSVWCNTQFQGLVADWAKAALYAVTEACETAEPGSLLDGVKPCAFIHDEVIFEIPYADKKRASEAALHLRDIMCETARSFCPDYPPTASPAFMTRLTKNSQDGVDENGFVRCVDPKVSFYVSANLDDEEDL